MNEPILSLSGVTASYGTIQVLRGVGLAVAGGEVRLLVGRNGSGKSTTLKAIAGLVPINSGSIRIAGDDVLKSDLRKRLAMGIGYVAQAGNSGRAIFPHLTVRENLEIMLIANSGAMADYNIAWALFPELKQFAFRRATALSGGQQQMLAIAMAMMLKPRVLLLDEPTCGLARGRAVDLMKVLRQLADDQGVSILLVEQNVSLTLDQVDSVSALRAGQVVAEVTPDTLRDPSWFADVL